MGKLGDVAALVAGCVLPLSLAPFDYWWLAPLPLMALMLLTQQLGLTVARLCFRYFMFGIGYFAVGASWVYVSIHDYGYTSMPFAMLLTSLWVAGLALVFALPWWWWSTRVQTLSDTTAKRWLLLLGFPAMWVLNEWMRTWLLTGFPWLFVGYSQTQTWLGGWAPVLGIYGVSFWVVLLASAAVSVMYRCSPVQRAWVRWSTLGLVAFLAVGGGFLLGSVPWTQAVPGFTQPVVLVQGNVAQEEKWQPEQREAIRELYRSLSEPFFEAGQLVVWPEAAIPELYTDAHPFFLAIRAALYLHGGALISGVPSLHRDENGERVFHNSLLGLGEAAGFYHKRRLVPFGEYIPLQSVLKGLLDFFKLPISDFRTGPDVQNNLSTGKMKTAGSICYEIAYPDLVASQSTDADFLLTVSNDSWFGRSLGPHQHLQMAQMRARENGRELVRATSNGISAFVDVKGGIVSRSAQFEVATLRGTVQAYSGVTPFQRWGSSPIVVVCVLLLFGLVRWTKQAQLRAD